MAELSQELDRQIGILVARSGKVTHVIVGDATRIFIPSLDDFPLGRKALRSLRLIHTHLRGEPLTEDDMTDLALLRGHLVAAIDVDDEALSDVQIGRITAAGTETAMEIPPPYRRPLGRAQKHRGRDGRRRWVNHGDSRERAILVSASKRPKHEQEESTDELRELALSSDVVVLDTVIQRPREINPKYLMGEGRIKELIIEALNKGATLLIFDQDLGPSQIKAISDITEMKVIDRSQLILDIFARRAHSRDGKVQVELAQLKYRLPRLTGKGTAMSRLMGGIGGRGPGESKLENDRRRVRERITLLERELKTLGLARKQRKSRRVEAGLPIVSIVGYTNAGKSTLLNSLTRSATFVENKMFATLDTASRRLRFPREREVIITDTVGFIRDLPKDLMTAFKATLEELADADVLIHVLDVSNPRVEQQMEAVEKILAELSLESKSRIIVLNKIDLADADMVRNLSARYNAVSVSALRPATFGPLMDAIQEHVWHEKPVGARHDA